MNDLLKNVNEIDNVITILQKIKSQIESGRIIQAYRDCGSLLSKFSNHRQEVIKEAAKNVK